MDHVFHKLTINSGSNNQEANKFNYVTLYVQSIDEKDEYGDVAEVGYYIYDCKYGVFWVKYY